MTIIITTNGQDRPQIGDPDGPRQDESRSARNQDVEILEPAGARPEKCPSALSARRESDDGPAIIDGQGTAIGSIRQCAQIFHATAGRPQKGPSAARTPRVADHFAAVVDADRLAVGVARHGTELRHPAVACPQKRARALSTARATNDVPRVADGERSAVLALTESAEGLHLTVGRPQDGLDASRAAGVAHGFIAYVDAEGLARTVARQRAQIPEPALTGPEKGSNRCGAVGGTDHGSQFVDGIRSAPIGAGESPQVLEVLGPEERLMTGATSKRPADHLTGRIEAANEPTSGLLERPEIDDGIGVGGRSRVGQACQAEHHGQEADVTSPRAPQHCYGLRNPPTPGLSFVYDPCRGGAQSLRDSAGLRPLEPALNPIPTLRNPD